MLDQGRSRPSYHPRTPQKFRPVKSSGARAPSSGLAPTAPVTSARTCDVAIATSGRAIHPSAAAAAAIGSRAWREKRASPWRGRSHGKPQIRLISSSWAPPLRPCQRRTRAEHTGHKICAMDAALEPVSYRTMRGFMPALEIQRRPVASPWLHLRPGAGNRQPRGTRHHDRRARQVHLPACRLKRTWTLLYASSRAQVWTVEPASWPMRGESPARRS